MIKDNSATGADKYKEYLLIDNQLVQIGDTSIDLTNYIQKPTTFTEGNIPTLTSTGELQDSGIPISNMNQLNIATSTVLGGVYSSSLDNHVSVTNLGYMQINRVSTNKLYVPDGDEFILNGGGA